MAVGSARTLDIVTGWQRIRKTALVRRKTESDLPPFCGIDVVMTYRLPPLNGLRAFEAAARNASFKTAADELGVTPGAVGQQVRKLEETLGVSLFLRKPNGLSLTREGELLHPRVAAAFDALTDATEEIAPDINAKKFSIGLGKDIRALLPAGWPRHSNALDAYVRDYLETDTLHLIVENKLDCVVRIDGGPFGGLSAAPIATADSISRQIHYVCRNGLMNCRQSRAIIEELETCLR